MLKYGKPKATKKDGDQAKDTKEEPRLVATSPLKRCPSGGKAKRRPSGGKAN